MSLVALSRAIREVAGVDLTKLAITTCRSDVTNAILSLVLERFGHCYHAL